MTNLVRAFNEFAASKAALVGTLVAMVAIVLAHVIIHGWLVALLPLAFLSICNYRYLSWYREVNSSRRRR